MRKLVLFIILLIPFNVSAYGSAYIVMDTDNNRVLEGNNIHAPHLVASTSKIMTALVVLNNIDVNQEVVINSEVLKSYGSGIYVEVGEQISVLDLFYGLMLRSGNDAAIALANEVGGSMAGFVTLMNETAQSIGMKNTNYLNSHGLEEAKKGNTSSAYDMALLSSFAMQNEIFRKITSTRKHIVKTNYKTYLWHNKNKLMLNYEYCTGGKTGFTELARRTLVTTASKNNVNLTIVTFKDGDDFNDHETLYNKYFSQLKKYPILKKGDIVTKQKNTFINDDFAMSLTEKEYQNIKININYYEQNVTNILGEVMVSLYGKVYFKTPIYLKEYEPRLTFWQKLKNLLS